MASDFYTEWLGVPAGPRPPDHYTLLGVKVFCRDQDVIEQAARRQLTRLDEFALYPDRDTRDAVQDMMNEVARARVDLVNPKRRLAYDRKLAQKLGVATPPAVEAETSITPSSVSEAQVPIESEPPLQAAAAVAEEVVDVAAQFETRAWSHLQKWKLNAHEQRMLLAEAAALGVAADKALSIIARIDSEAEILAEKKHKRQMSLVLGLAAAAVVVVITGLILFVVTSQRASKKADFLTAIEAARKCVDEGDLEQAADELAKARAIFPDDPMREAVANEVAIKSQEMEKAFTGALLRVRSLTDLAYLDQAASELARAKAIFPYDPRVKEAANKMALQRKITDLLSRIRSLADLAYLDQAESELARAKTTFPGDPRLKKAADEVTVKRKALEEAFTSALSQARAFMDRGELDRAARELAKIRRVCHTDLRYIRLFGELTDRSRTREEKFRQAVSTMSVFLAAGNLDAAAKNLAEAASTLPGDARLTPLRRKLGEKRWDAAGGRKPPNQTMVLTLPSGVRLKLVLIPAGKFQMGSPTTEHGRSDTEGPRREVTISKPFYIGVTEVTQAQWKAVMGTEPWSGKTYAKSVGNNAASCINWDDATSFCEALSKKTGKKVMVPTEAQWEYACRAGSRTAYSFGDDASKLGDYAWCDKNAYDVGEKYAHSVGQKKSNAFGLYDMHGNVLEWCSDWYDKDFFANAKNVDPENTTASKCRVLRGGSWSINPANCRAAYRDWSTAVFRHYGFGFRVVVVSDLGVD